MSRWSARGSPWFPSFVISSLTPLQTVRVCRFDALHVVCVRIRDVTSLYFGAIVHALAVLEMLNYTYFQLILLSIKLLLANVT